jgi:hypothetical protein
MRVLERKYHNLVSSKLRFIPLGANLVVQIFLFSRLCNHTFYIKIEESYMDPPAATRRL